MTPRWREMDLNFRSPVKRTTFSRLPNWIWQFRGSDCASDGNRLNQGTDFVGSMLRRHLAISVAHTNSNRVRVR